MAEIEIEVAVNEPLTTDEIESLVEHAGDEAFHSNISAINATRAYKPTEQQFGRVTLDVPSHAKTAMAIEAEWFISQALEKACDTREAVVAHEV